MKPFRRRQRLCLCKRFLPTGRRAVGVMAWNIMSLALLQSVCWADAAIPCVSSHIAMSRTVPLRGHAGHAGVQASPGWGPSFRWSVAAPWRFSATDDEGDRPDLRAADNRAWYVRPSGGDYGNEDGTSYEDAWDGLESIDWTKIKPGHTLYVSGEFCYSEYRAPMGLVVGASGAPGDLIEINGDCKSVDPSYENGCIWAGVRVAHDEWTGKEGDAWYRTDWHYHTAYAAAGSVGSETLLVEARSEADCATIEGSYYHDEAREVLYCNPVGDVPADFWSVFSPTGAVYLNGHDHVAIRNLKLRGASGNRGVVLLNQSTIDPNDPSQHWEITGCDIAFGSFTGIYTDMDSDHGLIDNNIIHDVPSGTYTVSRMGVTDDVTFSNNEVFSGSDTPNLLGVGRGDRHALGGQCGNNLLFEYNYIHDWIGGGIHVYFGSGCESHNVTIRYNWIENLNDSQNQYTHWGIARSSTNSVTSTDRSRNWKIHHNIITDCGGRIGSDPASADGIGIRIKSGVPTTENTTQVYNNVVANCNYGFVWQADVHEDEIGFDLKNNIFLNHTSGGHHIHIAGNGQLTDFSYVDMDNNIYFPNTASSFRWRGRSAKDLAGFREDARASGITIEEHSMTSEPGLSADFYPQQYSPAIDAGADVGLTMDSSGTPIPTGSAPDIGAYEFVFSTSDLEPGSEDGLGGP